MADDGAEAVLFILSRCWWRWRSWQGDGGTNTHPWLAGVRNADDGLSNSTKARVEWDARPLAPLVGRLVRSARMG